MYEEEDLLHKRCLLYALSHHTLVLLREYIQNINQRYDFLYAFPKILGQYRHIPFDKVIFINIVFDETVQQTFPTAEICIFNIDSLTNEWTLQQILDAHARFPGIRIYDYHVENTRLLRNYQILNTQYIEYVYDEKEVAPLRQLWQDTPKVYDFGIIAYTPEISFPERRRILVDRLRQKGFTVNVACGFDGHRDWELSRCRIILNIHGKSENQTLPTLMFEHLRCNRLLYAGFQILSEPSVIDADFSLRFENLKFMRYNDFSKLTTDQIHRFRFDALEFDKQIRVSEEWTRFHEEDEFCCFNTLTVQNTEETKGSP